MVFFLILALSSSQGHAESLSLINPLKALEEIENLPGTPPTRTPCPTGNCPDPLRKLNGYASDAFLYRVVKGEYPAEKCLENQTIPPVADLQNVFSQVIRTSDDDFSPYSASCAPDISDPVQRQSLLFIQEQYYRERINRGAIRSLLALHETDSILTGSPSAMKSISCQTNVSSKVAQVCQELKQCPRVPQREALVKLIHTALKRRQELEQSMKKIESKIRRLNRRQSQERGQLKHWKDIRSTLEKSIAEVGVTIPWIKGKIFGKSIDDIEEGIAKNRDADSVKKQIEAALIGQVQDNKKELMRFYDQSGEAVDCLKGKQKCDRFERILSKAPPVLPETNSYAPLLPPDVQTAYRQLEMVQCLEQEVGSAKNYNDIALSVGEISLGLVIGGVGGVAGLASGAVRVLRHGYHLKGSLSLLGLGTLGVTTYRNFDMLKTTCKEASRHLIGMKDGDSQVSCISKNYPQNVSQYLSCLTELALTGAAIIPPVIGKGVQLSSGAKGAIRKRLGGKRQSSVENAEDIKKMKEFQKWGKRMSEEEFDSFRNLLDELSAEEIKAVQPYIKYINEKKIDPLVLYRALRYSRVLSGGKRKEFVNHLDEALGRGKDSINRSVRTFLRREDRHTKRVAKLEKKYREQASDAGKESAMELARRKSHRIEDVLLSCRSRSMNVSHQRGISLFGKATVGMTGASIVTGYAGANWHLPKDTEWFAKLGYELVYAMMHTKLLIKVMKNPSSSFLGRYAQANVGSTMVEGIDAGIYAQFFGMEEDDARDALNRIKNDPGKTAALKELSQYLDESGFVEGFQQSFVNNFRNLFKTVDTGETDIMAEEGLPEGLENISEKDLDDPKVQDKLLEAVVAQYYDSERGYLNLESKGMERFTFNRTWAGALGIPKNIAMAFPIYYALCLTSVWPVGGMVAAAGLQALNQLISKDAYFKSRKYLINQ